MKPEKTDEGRERITAKELMEEQSKDEAEGRAGDGKGAGGGMGRDEAGRGAGGGVMIYLK